MIDLKVNKQIWSKLTKYNYFIEIISIVIDNKNIILDIFFEKEKDLEKFREIIFDNMLINIGVITSNQLTLFLDLINDLKYLESIEYPINTQELYIYSNYDKRQIKFGILPTGLKKLSIGSIYSFDITNLPNKLEILDLSISGKFSKFNFDFLPESLKILKYENYNDYYTYNKKDFENLPNSLEQIYIGGMFFNSTQELLEKFDIKKSISYK